jgi:hypothetical protein
VAARQLGQRHIMTNATGLPAENPMLRVKVAEFGVMVAGIRQPPTVSAEARQIADQMRALAETVRAGRDEWVVAAAQRAQRGNALDQRRGFWR